MIKWKDENRMPELDKVLKSVNRKKIEWGIFKGEIANYASANEWGATIKVTEKMRNYLHFIGIHLKADTKTIVIPERSFLRFVADSKKVSDKVVNALSQAYELDTAGMTILKQAGEILVGSTKMRIGGNVPPPNAKITKDLKGSSRTLVADGTMRRAVEKKIS
jgi:hypothetical protein